VIDWFVLLTPLLMLGVIALVRFVGCNQVFGLGETVLIEEAPTNLHATAGDRRINLTWDYEQGDATSFTIYYHEVVMGQVDNVADYVEYQGAVVTETIEGQVQHESSSLTDHLENGHTYIFRVVAHTQKGSSALDKCVPSNPATPGVTPFVTLVTPGGLRNDFTGWVGMAVQMNDDVIVTQLGRLVLANNVGTHDVQIVDPGQANAVVAKVALSMPAGPIGEFAYGPVTPPVTLMKNRLYYFVTHEDNGGDNFYNINGLVVSTSPIGTILSAVYNTLAPDTYVLYGSNNQTYGPVNFTY